MIEVAEADAFLAILSAPSLSAAARARGIDPTTLGRLVDRLEARVGVQLLHRTTRALHATPAGELFAQQAHLLVEQARALNDSVAELAKLPRGQLRLSLCGGYSRARLMPALSEWASRQRDTRIDVRFEDDAIDLASAGVDLAVRVVPATALDVIQTRLETYEHVLVAAPAWLARIGAPAQPADLEKLPCIAIHTDRAWTRWRFRRGAVTEDARIQPVAEVNDAELLVAFAESGVGATVLPRYLADEPLRRKRLVRLLREWTLPSGAAYVLHARRRRLSAIARDCLALFQRVA